MRLCRFPGLNRPGVYALQGLGPIQPLLERVARRRAVAAFRRARAKCPAYRQFLDRNGFTTRADVRTFPAIPETNKHNYVKPFSIEDRCFDGRIPAAASSSTSPPAPAASRTTGSAAAASAPASAASSSTVTRSPSATAPTSSSTVSPSAPGPPA